MNFELSRRFKANVSGGEILNFLESAFRKNAENVSATSSGWLQVESINATFGSINRKDTTTVEIREKDGDVLLVANVNYKPSTWFWIFFVCGLFTTIGELIPVIFYFYQKNTVKTAIEEIFNRAENEFRENSGSNLKNASQFSTNSKTATPHIEPSNAMEQIEKLGALMEKGLLSKEEFEAQKAKLLGSI